jgi:hypothetical protein
MAKQKKEKKFEDLLPYKIEPKNKKDKTTHLSEEAKDIYYLLGIDISDS